MSANETAGDGMKMKSNKKVPKRITKTLERVANIVLPQIKHSIPIWKRIMANMTQEDWVLLVKFSKDGKYEEAANLMLKRKP